MSTARILITGASGQLGRLVIQQLLEKTPAASLVALVRNSAAAAEFTFRGVEARVGDYETPATLDAALRGINKLLLISSNALGRRTIQHRNVIAAAQRAGVGFLA